MAKFLRCGQQTSYHLEGFELQAVLKQNQQCDFLQYYVLFDESKRHILLLQVIL